MDAIPNQLDTYFRELESRHKFSGVVRITQGEEECFTGANGFASRAWKIVLKNVDIYSNDSFSSFLLCQNESDWANYGALYPRGVKRTRDFFS